MGRTMDFRHDLSSNLWALPRGLHYSYPDGHLEWTSAHGSVVAACFDMMTADGVNDAGLAGHLLWLAEADYGQRDPQRPALPLSMWLQYFLDGRSSELVRLVHPVGTQFRRPGTVARFRVF